MEDVEHTELAPQEPCEEELDIIDCLEDYHRILVNVVSNETRVNGARKRVVAAYRDQQVRALIDRIKSVDSAELN